MFLVILDVLTPQELSSITTRLEDSTNFVDGKATAGAHAQIVKHNTQLSDQAESIQELRNLVNQALKRNPLFRMAILPKFIRPIVFSRYELGMSYGRHVDNTLMGEIRSDVSLTLFLSEPSTYEGGELVIESMQGEQAFKLNAGSMILYPSTTLHRVEPVTKGIRLAAVSWVQSLLRDSGEREILFNLDTARQEIFAAQGKTAAFDLISKSYASLLHKWCDV